MVDLYLNPQTAMFNALIDGICYIWFVFVPRDKGKAFRIPNKLFKCRLRLQCGNTGEQNKKKEMLSGIFHLIPFY